MKRGGKNTRLHFLVKIREKFKQIIFVGQGNYLDNFLLTRCDKSQFRGNEAQFYF